MLPFASGMRRRAPGTVLVVDDLEANLSALAAVLRLEDLERAFHSVVEELREQYVLGFHPAARRHDGSWRPLRVEVQGPYDVRARAGFVDD